MTAEELHKLHERVLSHEPHPFDPRLSEVTSPEEFLKFQTMHGNQYYRYLNGLVRELAPKRVLELGTDIGSSALFMMLALPPDSSLTTVEWSEYPRRSLIPFLEDRRLRVVHGDDLDLGIYKGDVPREIDLLYIDTEHTYEQVSKEWALYQQFLTPEAIVVVDDIHLNEGMERFWREIPYPKIDADRTIHFSGWGLFAFSRPQAA